MLLLELSRMSLGFALRNAERFPVRASEVFRQQNNLIHMARVMQQLARDRLENCVLTASDVHFADQVLGLERRNGIEDILPTGLPPLHDLSPSRARVNLEFAVTMAVRLFPVGSEKIGPARTHVSRQVLD